MKKLIVFSLAILIGSLAYAQNNLKFGPRVSLTSASVKAGDLIQANGQDLLLSFQNSSSSVQVGAFARVKLLGIYAQPEVLFGSSTVTYTLQNDDPTVEAMTREEKTYNVNVPVMFGLKLGPVRLQGGPVYSFAFGSRSELVDVDGYQRQFDRSDFDVRIGAGVDLGPIILDLTYQLPLAATQNVVTIDGFDYQIANPRGHLVGSVGFAF